MLFKLKNNSIYSIIVVSGIIAVVSGCMIPGSVVNHEQFETKLTSMKLEEYPAFKVYYGGATREIPLKEIKSIVIDPTDKIQHGDELYFSAAITLKDGSGIFSSEKDNTNRTTTFISIQNSLTGKRGSESFRINMGSVARIEVLQ